MAGDIVMYQDLFDGLQLIAGFGIIAGLLLWFIPWASRAGFSALRIFLKGGG